MSLDGTAAKRIGNTKIGTIMKKYIYILAAVAALASCAKEASINDDLAATNGSDIHELFVSIPDLVDADTKAAISSTDGTFTWTAGDAIAVKTTTGDVYQFTAETGGSQSARFTYTGTMNGTPAEVKYPYTADFSDTALPTEIASLTGALGADAIRMSGTISDNAVTLSHQNALLKVTFTNVPTFANKVVFDGDVNDVTVSGISLGSRGTVVAYIPVDASTTTFTVSVQDNNSHNIATKSTTSAKSFTAGTIKNMKPVDVDGHIFVFNDNDKVDEARFFATDGSTIDWETKSFLTLNVLSDGTTKWCILPTLSWSKTGDPVCLQVFKNGTYVSASDAVWLYRDFTFDTTESSLKTTYRIYVYMSDSQWTIWQTQGSGTSVVKFVTWDGLSTPDTNAIQERNADNNGYIFYYEFATSVYGTKTVKYRFYNECNAGWESKNESGVTINRDIWGANL